jgi:hypothetical protein
MHLVELHILAAVEQYLKIYELDKGSRVSSMDYYLLTRNIFRYLIIQHPKAPFAYHFEIWRVLFSFSGS